ncbi:helix-turn-helix domain-containing protein [Erysipelotrichaceae bacterium RD49]|nr:helix-turn-helix domain-containing protein [Erysipelotrichaceae bacterium RD49]
MNIPEALNQFKHDNNLTNDYIANYCGVTRSTVSRWCNGKIRKIGPETLAKLAEMLNIDLEDMNRIRGLQLKRPILGTVKAGYGLLADENIDGYVEVSEADYAKGDYFLRVTGDSMKDAHIHEGDLLYVKQCTDLPSGAIAVLLIGGEEVTVKKLIKKDRYWILQAANTEVEPRVYTLKEVEDTPVQIIGRAVFSRTDLSLY